MKKSTPISKTNTCLKRKMSIVMHEWKTGKLFLKNGNKVTNQKQAVAIGLSVARKTCLKKSRKRQTRKNNKRSRIYKKKSRK